MTPKQKAKDILDRIESESMQSHEYNVQCALIVADEVYKAIPDELKVTKTWWKWVKEEIERL